MERERTFNPSARGSKPPGSATRVRQSFGGQARRKRVPVVARRAKMGCVLDTLGPVTVAAERRGLLTRWRKPDAGSNPAWSSSPSRQGVDGRNKSGHDE